MSKGTSLYRVGLPDWRVILSTQVRAFAFASLIPGLLLAAAPRAMHAQNFDTMVGQSVAGVARQTGQPARRFDLTLDDAVQRALQRNLDVAVQRIHPLVQDMQVAAADAAFLPVASSGFGFNQATTPNRFVLTAVGSAASRSFPTGAATTSGSGSRSSGAAAGTTSPGTPHGRSRRTSSRPSTRASART